MTGLPPMLDFAAIHGFYDAGGSLAELIEEVIRRLAASKDPAIFISRFGDETLRAAARDLTDRAPDRAALPLWGVPFAVKDNIDVAGLPTTAGCPDYAYEPERHATAVARLVEAGAIMVGKANLDQFATGLNGTRSPYGAPRCVFDADYVSGGSSSGSAVAVAAGLVAFALGTDTAGSGRVPAAFNNIVGIKPTPGRVPITGLVPACRSLDVITIFAPDVADALAVRRVMEGYEAEDPFSRRAGGAALPERPRIGVLDEAEREFFGNAGFERLYDAAIARAESLGAEIVTFDYAPFREAAALLYEGPWVAERLAAIEDFVTSRPDAMDPTVRTIVEGARGMSAIDAFRGIYALQEFRRRTETEWAKTDMLMLPTSADICTVAAMRADPIALNSRFGRYTNFANLLGCAAIAVPAGFDERGLPFGVTLVGQRDTDESLAHYAHAMHAAAACGSGVERAFARFAAPAVRHDGIDLVVVGAHLSGMPLNNEITSTGGHLVRAARTTADYRLYALPGGAKPGLVRDPGFAGPGIEIEVWRLPAEAFGRFVAAIPAPLGIGRIRLADGGEASGFLCDAAAIRDAEEITRFGGWRAWCAEASVAAK